MFASRMAPPNSSHCLGRFILQRILPVYPTGYIVLNPLAWQFIVNSGTAARFCAEHYCGQMYPAPVGLLKQPTDSGITCFGSHSTTFGKKIVNVMVNRKTT